MRRGSASLGTVLAINADNQKCESQEKIEWWRAMRLEARGNDCFYGDTYALMLILYPLRLIAVTPSAQISNP